MGQSLLLRHKYGYALRMADCPMLLEVLKNGADINRPVYPVGVMDIFLNRRYKPGIEAVLKDPKWNPNYISKFDGLSLIERAMTISEDLAMKVTKHPNFDPKARLGCGRTVAMAALMFSSPRMYKAFKDETLPTDTDESGYTLSDYQKTFGRPRRGRLASINRQVKMQRLKMLEEAQYVRNG